MIKYYNSPFKLTSIITSPYTTRVTAHDPAIESMTADSFVDMLVILTAHYLITRLRANDHIGFSSLDITVNYLH